MAEKNNGSPAFANGGTANNSSASNTTIGLSLFQGESYKKLEYYVVEESLKWLRSSGTMYTTSLSAIADDVLTQTRFQVQQLNQIYHLKWRMPNVLSPIQAALIVREHEIVRLVCTEDDLDDPKATGVLAAYQKDGEYEGTYREIGVYQVAKWAFDMAGAVEKKWRTEFYTALYDYAERVCECKNPNYVFMKNGILNYETKERISFSPDIVSLRKSPVLIQNTEPPLPVHTKPDGSTIDFWQWIDSLAPYDGGRDLLIKLIGAVMRNRHVWRVMITLFNSNGKNGKSTFLRLLKACVGFGSVMTSNIANLCDDKFGLARLPGCSLITCEDSDSGTYIRATTSVKCIISHDPVSVERKGQDAFDYTPHCLIVSASNDLPKTKDKTPAWQGRNIYIPFTGDFSGDVEDKTISSEWVVSQEFCQYAVYQALIKWDNYYTLPEPSAAVALKQEFMSENDSVLEFLEWFEDRGTLDFIPNGYAWYKYRPWMQEHRPNTQLPTEKSFVKHLAEVAVATGRWLQPKENDGYCRRFQVSAWCQCKDQIHEYDVLQKSPAYSRGIVRKEVWEYCQKYHVTPKDMNIKDYDAMRKQYGIIRTGDMMAEDSHSNVIQFKQM